MECKNTVESIEKARADIMSAECTLWNIDTDNNDKYERDYRISSAINALHNAERILRGISKENARNSCS